MKVRRICLTAMFMAMAIVLSIAESFIPSIGIPGIKLGLANIFVLLVLYEFGLFEAFLVNLGRVFITALVRGTIFQMGFFMSLSGAIFSMLVMWAIIKISEKITPIAISVIGALFHILAQFVVAIIYLESTYVLYYAPILLLLSVGTGILVGSVVILLRKTKIVHKLAQK